MLFVVRPLNVHRSSVTLYVSVDAVYAAAHAIHNLIETECGTDPFYLCDELKPAPVGPLLLKYLRNVSFVGKYQNK